MKCSRCQTNMHKNGTRDGKQRWKCGSCGYEKQEKEKLNKNILIIADTHAPAVKKGYLEFCMNIRDKYECDTIIHIGDEVDHHALSNHPKIPDGLSAGDEYRAAYKELQRWFKAFPEVKVCIGNHSSRMFRKAIEFGVPYGYLKKYKEVWDAPDEWVWEYEHVVNGVIFTHGTNTSGLYPHINLAKKNRQSTCIGHHHCVFGVEWSACQKDMIFGMCVGSGMSSDTYASEYAITFPTKPIVGCGVVTDYGKNPFVVRMEL